MLSHMIPFPTSLFLQCDKQTLASLNVPLGTSRDDSPKASPRDRQFFQALFLGTVCLPIASFGTFFVCFGSSFVCLLRPFFHFFFHWSLHSGLVSDKFHLSVFVCGVIYHASPRPRLTFLLPSFLSLSLLSLSLCVLSLWTLCRFAEEYLFEQIMGVVRMVI